MRVNRILKVTYRIFMIVIDVKKQLIEANSLGDGKSWGPRNSKNECVKKLRKMSVLK
jgi:hypothetical protein